MSYYEILLWVTIALAVPGAGFAFAFILSLFWSEIVAILFSVAARE